MDRDHRLEQADERQTEPSQAGAQQVDVRELAERVYRLMRDELRLARVRGERAAPGKG